jgi:starch synthase (maltosyl-transferring)
MIVNLDPHHRHHSFVHVPVSRFGLGPNDTYQVHDLLTDRRYLWKGEVNFVDLDPQDEPAHLFKILP